MRPCDSTSIVSDYQRATTGLWLPTCAVQKIRECVFLRWNVLCEMKGMYIVMWYMCVMQYIPFILHNTFIFLHFLLLGNFRVLRCFSMEPSLGFSRLEGELGTIPILGFEHITRDPSKLSADLESTPNFVPCRVFMEQSWYFYAELNDQTWYKRELVPEKYQPPAHPTPVTQPQISHFPHKTLYAKFHVDSNW